MDMLKSSLGKLYQKYELITCISMFEPWERKLINGFVALTLSLMLFSSFFYLPTYIETFLQFLSPLPMDGAASPTLAASTLHTQKMSVS